MVETRRKQRLESGFSLHSARGLKSGGGQAMGQHATAVQPRHDVLALHARGLAVFARQPRDALGPPRDLRGQHDVQAVARYNARPVLESNVWNRVFTYTGFKG